MSGATNGSFTHHVENPLYSTAGAHREVNTSSAQTRLSDQLEKYNCKLEETEHNLHTTLRELEEFNDMLQDFLENPESSANHIVLGMNLEQRRKARGKETGNSVPTWV